MRVPYTPYPEGGVPSGPYAPRLNIDINANMFGAPQAAATQKVGEAVSRLGSSIASVAGNLTGQQGIENDTAARDLDVQGMTKLGELQTKFYSLEGKNAIEAAPQYTQDVQALRTQILGQAPNDTVKKKVDQLFSTNIGNAIVSGGRHVAQQEKIYTRDTADASLALSTQKAAGSDNSTFQQIQDDTIKSVQLKASSGGWSPERLEYELSQEKSKNWTARLNYQALEDPRGALETYNQHKQEISPEFRTTIEKQIWGAVNTKGAADSAKGLTDTAPPTMGAIPAGQTPVKNNLFSSGAWRGDQFNAGTDLTQIHVAGASATVNKWAAPAFQGFLQELSAKGYHLESVQGYNDRNKRGSSSKSEHAFGNAIDINPEKNSYEPNGTSTSNLPSDVSKIAAKYGLAWGGDWSPGHKDFMHFEWVAGDPFRGQTPLGPGYRQPATGVFPGGMVPGNIRAVIGAQLAIGGLNEVAKAGVLANVQHESSFNPTVLGDGGTAFGLFQHRDERLTSLKSFAMANKGNPNDPAVQTAFAIQEAKSITTDNGIPLLTAMNAAATPTDAAELWQKYFERPKVLDARRGATAEKIYNGDERGTAVKPPTQADVIARAKQRAASYIPASVYGEERAREFEEATVRHAVTNYNLDIGAKREEQSQAKQTIYEHMQDPKIEDTDTLLKDPEAYEAWQKTTPEFQYRVQQHYTSMAEKNAKDEERESKAQAHEAAAEQKVNEQQASSATRERLTGLAIMEPRKFLNTDLAGAGLTKGDFNALVTKRNEVSKGIQSDVPMTGIIKRLQSLGVFQGTEIDTKEYKENDKLHQFVGALHQLILEEKAATGEMPNIDGQAKLAGTLIRTQPGLLWGESKVLNKERVKQVMNPKTKADLIEYQKRYQQAYPDRTLPPIEEQLKFLDNLRSRRGY